MDEKKAMGLDTMWWIRDRSRKKKMPTEFKQNWNEEKGPGVEQVLNVEQETNEEQVMYRMS